MYETGQPGNGPLRGIRVIDLTAARAGPTCTRALAQMGAEVIQVWPPAKTDIAGSDWANLHHSKRSIVIDLTRAEGRAVLLRLVRDADVLVENWRPGVKHRLGLAPSDLCASNPHLIYGSISGFGQDGEAAERPGVDPIAQGYAGLMSVTGPPGTGPWRVGIAIADTASGMFLTQGILAALVARGRTGRGQWVHTSLVESLISMMDFQAVRWLVEREVPGQVGNEHPTFMPFGTFRTADGIINIGSTNFPKFCALIGAPEMASDPRFASQKVRNAHRPELRAEIERCLMRRSSRDWIALLGAELAVGPVLRMDEVFEEPLVRHLNMTRTLPHPEAGSMQVLRYPVGFSDTPAEPATGIAIAGADTRAVLAEHGYAAAEIEALLASRVVALRSGGEPW